MVPGVEGETEDFGHSVISSVREGTVWDLFGSSSVGVEEVPVNKGPVFSSSLSAETDSDRLCCASGPYPAPSVSSAESRYTREPGNKQGPTQSLPDGPHHRDSRTPLSAVRSPGPCRACLRYL